MERKTLIEIILSSESWEELREKIERENFKIKNSKIEFVRQIKQFWSNNYEPRESFQEGVLPFSHVSLGETKIFVHGVVHPIPKYKPSDFYMRFVRDYAESYIDLCEEGLKDLFQLENTDIVKIPEEKKIPNLFQVFNLFRFLFLSNRKSRRCRMEFAKLVENYDDILILRKNLWKEHLPEPLEMKIFDYLSLKKGSLLVLRSRTQAQSVYEYILKKQKKEVHVLTGFYHEPQIIYFLKQFYKADTAAKAIGYTAAFGTAEIGLGQGQGHPQPHEYVERDVSL